MTPTLDILYEDNHMIGVVKPSGVLSQGDGSSVPDMLSIIGDYIKKRDQKPGNVFVGLVHRLDRNVGGTMIFAKTSKGASRLSESMRKGDFFKGYYVLTENRLSAKEGLLINSLWKDDQQNRVYERKEGKLSRLYYQNIGSNNGYNLYFAIPITGRTHQIRAQFSFAGAPLVGDRKYGSDKGNGYQIGLWSGVVSVPHPVRRDETLLITSIPNGEVWRRFKKLDMYIESFVTKLDVKQYEIICGKENSHGV